MAEDVVGDTIEATTAESFWLLLLLLLPLLVEFDEFFEEDANGFLLLKNALALPTKPFGSALGIGKSIGFWLQSATASGCELNPYSTVSLG